MQKSIDNKHHRLFRRSAHRHTTLAVLATLTFATAILHGTCSGQQKKDQGEFSRYAGDSSTTELRFANISTVPNHKAIAAALHKVAEWQFQRSQAHYDQDWTFAVLYAGFMAIPDEAGGARYRASMGSMGKSFGWQLGTDIADANDDAVGQTYLSLHSLTRDATAVLPTQRAMDDLLRRFDAAGNGTRPLWWWCDALFMAPPVLAQLSKETDEPRYLNFMDRQWQITSDTLYDKQQHLFLRDARFFTRREANGQRIFWSRGNGWVMGGLVRVLQAMPKDYAQRPRYIALLQEMATALITLQRPDGLWSVGLLDPDAYPMAETSGTSLITYGIAYGVNQGFLDRSQFEPQVIKAWQGLVSHIYADGRLGAIQPVADSPGKFAPTSSYVYGVGAFLLAGSEVYKMQDK